MNVRRVIDSLAFPDQSVTEYLTPIIQPARLSDLSVFEQLWRIEVKKITLEVEEALLLGKPSELINATDLVVKDS